MSLTRNPRSNRLLLLACLMPIAGLTACNTPSHYLDESDFITPGFGQTQAWNKSIHVVDPNPTYAYNTRIPGDGRRTARVMDQYSRGNGGAVAVPSLPSVPQPSGDGESEGKQEAKK